MSKKYLYMAIVAAIVVILLLWVRPQREMCADTIRGYRESADSSLSAIRTGIRGLDAKLGSEAKIEVPQIPELNAAKF